jgi:hypothetical protein
MKLLLSSPIPGNAAIAQADIRTIDLVQGRITFRWLDPAGEPVDLGISLADIAPGVLPTAESLEEAILASTA